MEIQELEDVNKTVLKALGDIMIRTFVYRNVVSGLLLTILQENVLLNVLKLRAFTLTHCFEFVPILALEDILVVKSIKPVFQSVKLTIGEIPQQLYALHYVLLRYIHMVKM